MKTALRPATALCLVVGLAIPAALVSCRWTPDDAATNPGPAKPAPDAAKANRRCLQCHIDFEKEELVVVHQENGVTCMRCHGHSQPHMEDEIRATKADVTYKGLAMNVFCLTCHDPAAYPEVPLHASELGKPFEKRHPCTACHGEHKLLELTLDEPDGA